MGRKMDRVWVINNLRNVINTPAGKTGLQKEEQMRRKREKWDSKQWSVGG